MFTLIRIHCVLMESIALPAFEQPEPVQESAASIHCVDFPKAEQCVLKHILHVNA